MGTHYIPQHYLKGFTDPHAPSLIWVYEKGKPEPFRTNVKNIAHETDYYPDDVEQYLANTIEWPAQPVIDKIRKQELITPQDKARLAAYMVVMLKRVPRSRERRREMSPGIIDSVFGDLEMQLAELLAAEPTNEVLLRRRDEVKQLRAKYEAEIPREIDHQLLPPETSPRLLAALQEMTWLFWVHDKEPVFLTSDNPVFYFEGIGVGQEHSEVTFPISSHIVLWATWRRNQLEEYVRIRETLIRELNRRTASAATRYVFHRSAEPWVMKLLNRRRHRLNRIS